MSNDYLPARDTEFLNWMNAFMGYASGNTAALGMASADLNALYGVVSSFGQSLQSSGYAQQQARSAVAAKEMARKAAEAAFRSRVRIIQARPETTDTQRQALGITARDLNPTANTLAPGAVAQLTRPKISVDTSQRLQHVLKLEDSDEASRRRRPEGATGCEIFSRIVSDAPWQYLDVARKLSHVIRYEQAQANMVVQYQCRWVYRDGTKGPWSEVVAATIVG